MTGPPIRFSRSPSVRLPSTADRLGRVYPRYGLASIPENVGATRLRFTPVQARTFVSVACPPEAGFLASYVELANIVLRSC
jgi:hypothetical protein